MRLDELERVTALLRSFGARLGILPDTEIARSSGAGVSPAFSLEGKPAIPPRELGDASRR